MSIGIANISKIYKGNIITVLNEVEETTTSNEIDISGYNSILVSATITGTGTYKIDVNGRLDSSDAVMALYDGSTQFTTGNITASKIISFAKVPDLITIVATEIDGTASCTVKVQPFNI